MLRAMSHNPYKPPDSAVADIPAPFELQRPRAVVIAVWLSWVSIALGIISSIVDFDASDPDLSPGLQIALAVAGSAISALLTVMIWRGRNWARILTLILSSISYAMLAVLMAGSPEFAAEMTSDAWLWAISAFLDVVFVVLIFGPGRAWFRRRD